MKGSPPARPTGHSINPGDLYCEIQGDGPPVVLIHGFGEHLYCWRSLVPRLAAAHQVFALDLNGFGLSPKPRDDSYSLDDQAELVCGFVQHHGLRQPTLIGHSMGGGVALLTAMKLQERGNPAAALVLVDSIAFPQPLPLFIKLLTIPVINWLGTRLIPPEVQVRIALRAVYFDDSKITEAAVRAYAEPLRQPGGRHALIATARRIVPENVDELVRRYAELNSPALILWGRQDALVPLPIAERLHRALEGSELKVIEECGHAPLEEKPEEAAPLVLDFLRRNSPVAGA